MLSACQGRINPGGSRERSESGGVIEWRVGIAVDGQAPFEIELDGLPVPADVLVGSEPVPAVPGISPRLEQLSRGVVPVRRHSRPPVWIVA
jgi:hypothetical protein